MKKQNCRRIERLMLVLVSCVIIAVALLNLLHPATAQAEQINHYSMVLTPTQGVQTLAFAARANRLQKQAFALLFNRHE